MRYTNKWVEFLNGANTIAINGEKDFTSLKSLSKKVGLDCFNNLAEEEYNEAFYGDLRYFALVNGCLIENCIVLVEYQPGKGFTIGYHSFEESEKWYGMKPWTMSEVLKSVRG